MRLLGEPTGVEAEHAEDGARLFSEAHSVVDEDHVLGTEAGGDGEPVPERHWVDTVLLHLDETAEIAFVADNPGDWLFHCHILEHHLGGMGAVIRVG